MGEMARVEIERWGDASIARVSGEIDISNAQEIGEMLERGLAKGKGDQIIDLTDVGYLDSVGVRLIFSLAERLRGRRRELHLVVPDDAVIRRVLELADVPKMVRMHARLDDALGRSEP